MDAQLPVPADPGRSARPLMTRKRFGLLALLLLVIGGVFVSWYRKQPTLQVLINGKPAAHIVVRDFQTMSPRVADAAGVLSYSTDSGKQNAVLVPSPGGGVWLISFPDRGHKTVNLRGRFSKSTTTVFDFSIIRREENTESYDLTDEETAAIERGELTLEDVQEKIRQEAAEQ